MKTRILGVKFNPVTVKEAANLLVTNAKKKKKTSVYTPNPEMVMRANEDADFMLLLNKGDVVLPDGYGIVLASILLKKNIKERAAGFDTIVCLLKKIKNDNLSIYFLGAKEEVVRKAASIVRRKYHPINVVGYHHGYFTDDEEVIAKINEASPDFLLVGLGSPKQEEFIDKYKDRINATVFIGCGGSFDVMSGKVKRAPKIMRKMGLEWFYRLLKEPKRFKRMLKLPIFVLEVVKNR